MCITGDAMRFRALVVLTVAPYIKGGTWRVFENRVLRIIFRPKG
jgi:hypothetical protein